MKKASLTGKAGKGRQAAWKAGWLPGCGRREGRNGKGKAEKVAGQLAALEGKSQALLAIWRVVKRRCGSGTRIINYQF